MLPLMGTYAWELNSPQWCGPITVSKISKGPRIWKLLMISVLWPKVVSTIRGESWWTRNPTISREAGSPWQRASRCHVSSLSPCSALLHLSEPLTPSCSLGCIPQLCITFSVSARIFTCGPSYMQPLWFLGKYQPWTLSFQRSLGPMPCASPMNHILPTLLHPNLTPQTYLVPKSQVHSPNMNFIRLFTIYLTNNGGSQRKPTYKTEIKRLLDHNRTAVLLTLRGLTWSSLQSTAFQDPS